MKVLCVLEVNKGRITIADAEGRFFFFFYLKILHHKSKTTKGLHDLNEGTLDAQIQQCNVEHFRVCVCALMCHIAGTNQSFLIHKSLSLKPSSLLRQHQFLRCRTLTHERRFL